MEYLRDERCIDVDLFPDIDIDIDIDIDDEDLPF